MTVCVDTNVVIVVFAAAPEFLPLRAALSDGALNWAVSTEILLEYEEISRRTQGGSRWEALASLIELISDLYGTIFRINPHFRFNVITHDPDDNKFVDCADHSRG